MLFFAKECIFYTHRLVWRGAGGVAQCCCLQKLAPVPAAVENLTLCPGPAQCGHHKYRTEFWSRRLFLWQVSGNTTKSHSQEQGRMAACMANPAQHHGCVQRHRRGKLFSASPPGPGSLHSDPAQDPKPGQTIYLQKKTFLPFVFC